MTKKISPIHKRVQEGANRKREEKIIRSLEKEFDPVKFKEVTKGLKMPTTPFWDDLKTFNSDTLGSISDYVLSFGERIKEALADPQTAPKLSGNTRLATLIQSIQMDFQSFQSRMSALYERHKDKSGTCTSQDEVLEVFDIQAEYQNILTIYTSNVAPAITEALQILGVMDDIVNDIVESVNPENALVDPSLQDPTVTSDIEFKEIKND